MEKGMVEVNGRQYVVGPGGVFVDFDGNPCGFLGGDLVRESGYEDREENLVDGLIGTLAHEGEKRGEKWGPHYVAAQAAAVVVGASAAAVHAAATEYGRWQEAEREADEAEARAREMEERVSAARRRHGRG